MRPHQSDGHDTPTLNEVTQISDGSLLSHHQRWTETEWVLRSPLAPALTSRHHIPHTPRHGLKSPAGEILTNYLKEDYIPYTTYYLYIYSAMQCNGTKETFLNIDSN